MLLGWSVNEVWKVWKVWEGRQSICITLKVFKNASAFLNPTEREDMKTSTHFICFARWCCSLSYWSFSTQTSWRWGCIYTLSSLFSLQALALSSLLPLQLLPFDVVTMRPLAPLQCRERRMCIQFWCIPAWGWQIAVLKCDKLCSWSVTPHPSNREHALQD